MSVEENEVGHGELIYRHQRRKMLQQCLDGKDV
jgi:hypothetical protein